MPSTGPRSQWSRCRLWIVRRPPAPDFAPSATDRCDEMRPVRRRVCRRLRLTGKGPLSYLTPAGPALRYGDFRPIRPKTAGCRCRRPLRPTRPRAPAAGLRQGLPPTGRPGRPPVCSWTTARCSGAGAPARRRRCRASCVSTRRSPAIRRFSPIRPTPPRSSPSPSRISAMSAPTPRISRRRPRRRSAACSAPTSPIRPATAAASISTPGSRTTTCRR